MNEKLVAELTELERSNDELALKAALEGIVLLQNNGVLPIKSKKVALYGSGARYTSKGGTGSGEVNNRRSINVEEGLESCGIQITTKSWLDDLDKEKVQIDDARKTKIKEIGKKYSALDFWHLMNALSIPIVFPTGRDITEEDVEKSDTDTAIYVIARQAGEGKDRHAEKSEYYPTEKEIATLKFLANRYKNTILVINAGACIDVSELLAARPGAVVYMGQAGQNGGLALAKLLLGEFNFSGKLAASWPKNLRDLPCSDSYSYLDGNTEREIYKDGIYVGYRYYDSFNVEPQFAFGYGLSYTQFVISAQVSLNGNKITVEANVENVGKTAGKEVVQVYLSCPSGLLKREYQQLAAFMKTDTIGTGESQNIILEFNICDFAAYDEARSRFILEAGNYIVRVGNSSRNTKPVATIVIESEILTEQCKAISGAQSRIKEIAEPCLDENICVGRVLHFDSEAVCPISHNYSEPPVKTTPETHKMTDKELVNMCVGDPAIMNGRIPDVVGACGQIDKKVCKKYGYRPAVMADGPAGIRIAMEYAVEPNGKIKTAGKIPVELIIAKKLFAFFDKMWSKHSKKAKIVHQFCTAWPVAAVQAQTFSPSLIEKIGQAVALEMTKYGVGIWLAPGMNIQRHPLCGRNFEYYSEDPILTASMASAVTVGVQSNPHCAVTIKHFCCNNQEDNRMKSSSEVNERAMREIYLKAFKITIRNSRPKCVMSSYNKVNGKYVNSTYELITNVLRNEFGFDGVVMTDWQIVAKDQAVAGEVLSAHNDLIMAGDKYQHKELYKALKEGKCERTALEQSAGRILELCRNLSSE